MKKISFIEGENEYTFGIEQCKFIISSNQIELYNFKKIFLKLMRQSDDSEYYLEHNHNETRLLINDKKIIKKHILFTCIHSSLNLSDELKLSSKSLLLKYFERKLSNADFNDTIQTLQILFDSLESEINDSSLYKIKFQKLTVKVLLKLSESYIEKNGYICNEYDLNYEDFILYQLDLLMEIEKDISLEHIFVLVDLPIISNLIFIKFKEFKKCNFIILSKEYPNNISLADFYLIGKIIVDCANEEQLYYEVSERSLHNYTLQEVQLMILKYIYHIEQCADDIIQLFE